MASHEQQEKSRFGLARYTSIAAVLIQLGIIIFVGTRTKFNLFGADPISNLGTTHLFTLYATAFILGGLMLVVLVSYLQHTYHPTSWFAGAMLLGILGEVLTGIVPDNLSNPNLPLEQLTRMHVHGIAATCLFLSVPVAMMLFNKSANNRSAARQSIYYFWLYVVTFIPGLILMQLHILYAVAELVSLLIFDAWVLQLTGFLPPLPTRQ